MDPDQTSQLIELLADDAFCDQLLDRQPYPAAATRSAIPGPDQCYGFVPLLALDGPNDPDHLDLCGMWEHIRSPQRVDRGVLPELLDDFSFMGAAESRTHCTDSSAGTENAPSTARPRRSALRHQLSSGVADAEHRSPRVAQWLAR